MDAKIAISISQLVDAALKGDVEVVTAYAAQLKKRLAELGEEETAASIEESLAGKKARNGVVNGEARKIFKKLPLFTGA